MSYPSHSPCFNRPTIIIDRDAGGKNCHRSVASIKILFSLQFLLMKRNTHIVRVALNENNMNAVCSVIKQNRLLTECPSDTMRHQIFYLPNGNMYDLNKPAFSSAPSHCIVPVDVQKVFDNWRKFPSLFWGSNQRKT